MTDNNNDVPGEGHIRELEQRISLLQAGLEDMKSMLLKEQEQKQFYQLVADFTFGWELWFDPSGRILYCSPSCHDLTGYTANQIISAPSVSEQLVYGPDREKFDAFVDDAINQLLVNVALEFRIITRTRQIRWCSMNARGVYNKQGRYLGIRASVHDITRLKGALGHISNMSAGKELEHRHRQRLESELDVKERELVAFLIQVSQKNELIALIKKQLGALLGEPSKNHRKKTEELLQLLQKDPQPSMNWELIDVELEKLHPGFMNRLVVKHPRLTARDRKLCACLRLGLTSREIAGLAGQLPQSIEIARVRLRKKIKIPREKRLVNYLLEI